jgi:hypothetical protein
MYSSIQPVCSYICALKFNEKKEIDKRTKEMKLNIRKLSYYEGLLETQINTIVRLIDKGHPCITSGSTSCFFHAGHYVSVGANKTIRFNLLNIFAQSEQDNFHKGGKGSNYGIRLSEVFGYAVRDEVEVLTAKYKELHWTREDLIEATLKAKEIVKELKSVNRTFSTDERIILRREFNERIGLYK